jgi:uroporphyrinogen decarboxylase
VGRQAGAARRAQRGAVAEIERAVPTLKNNGGYIFASDHSIPDDVDFATFGRIVEAYKQAAAY